MAVGQHSFHALLCSRVMILGCICSIIHTELNDLASTLISMHWFTFSLEVPWLRLLDFRLAFTCRVTRSFFASMLPPFTHLSNLN